MMRRAFNTELFCRQRKNSRLETTEVNWNHQNMTSFQWLVGNYCSLC